MEMVRLFEQDVKMDARQSSKGNQLKWYSEDIWYKADYMGYEGLAEYVISGLLSNSSLGKDEFVSYETETISYGAQQYLGCRSRDFLPKGWQLLTLERLFYNFYNDSFYKTLYRIPDHKARLKLLVDQTEKMTGLEQFGSYMTRLLTVDTLFMNEDRHLHNIAVLWDESGYYHECPVFDNGAALLSDIRMDYPMGGELEKLIGRAKAKTFCDDFDEQLEYAEELYGTQLTFSFDENRVKSLLNEEHHYPKEQKQRVYEIIMARRRKYQYLFQK